MPIKVEWNKEHTWKVTKKYKNGKLVSFKYNGLWYYPVKDYSGRVTDSDGNTYIGSDVCNNCELEKRCVAFNPICNACHEYNEVEINWIGCENKNKNDRVWYCKETDCHVSVSEWLDWLNS